MNSIEYWKVGIAVFCSIAIVQSLFLAGLFLVKSSSNKALPYLSLLLISLGLRIGKSIFSHLWTEKVYWGVLLGCAGLWLIGPSLIGYIRQRQQIKNTNLDWYHFLPVFLLLVIGNWLDFVILNWVYRLGTIVLSIYLVRSYFYNLSTELRKEVRSLLFCLILIDAAFIVQLITNTIEVYVGGSILACLSLYYLNFIALKDHRFLKKYAGPPSFNDELSTLYVKLNHLFQTEETYKTKVLTLAQVAKQLHAPAYLITRSIQHEGLNNFNQLVNQYRVTDIKTILEDPNRLDKVEQLAKDFGFAGVSSLYQAFKKETSMTLNAYRKRHKSVEPKEIQS